MEKSEQSRGGRVLSHLRHNVVGYAALLIAVSISPLPAYAAAVIADGSVTTAKLHNNAVTSPKIANGQVKKIDIAAGAKGYTSIKTVEETHTGLANGATTTFNVDCGVGRVAIGGGGWVSPSGIILIGSSAGEVVRSHPVNRVIIGDVVWWTPSGTAAAPRGWRTVVQNTTGDPDKTAYGYAICAKK